MGTGKAWAAQKRFKAAEFECNKDVLVAAVEKRGLTLPLGSVSIVEKEIEMDV